MSGPRAIEVRDGGFVSVERGPDDRDSTRLEVMTVDRSVALAALPTSDEAVAFGHQMPRRRLPHSGPGRDARANVRQRAHAPPGVVRTTPQALAAPAGPLGPVLASIRTSRSAVPKRGASLRRMSVQGRTRSRPWRS